MAPRAAGLGQHDQQDPVLGGADSDRHGSAYRGFTVAEFRRVQTDRAIAKIEERYRRGLSIPTCGSRIGWFLLEIQVGASYEHRSPLEPENGGMACGDESRAAAQSVYQRLIRRKRRLR
jgi:hypothetical protein